MATTSVFAPVKRRRINASARFSSSPYARPLSKQGLAGFYDMQRPGATEHEQLQQDAARDRARAARPTRGFGQPPPTVAPAPSPGIPMPTRATLPATAIAPLAAPSALAPARPLGGVSATAKATASAGIGPLTPTAPGPGPAAPALQAGQTMKDDAGNVKYDNGASITATGNGNRSLIAPPSKPGGQMGTGYVTHKPLTPQGSPTPATPAINPANIATGAKPPAQTFSAPMPPAVTPTPLAPATPPAPAALNPIGKAPAPSPTLPNAVKYTVPGTGASPAVPNALKYTVPGAFPSPAPVPAGSALRPVASMPKPAAPDPGPLAADGAPLSHGEKFIASLEATRKEQAERRAAEAAAAANEPKPAPPSQTLAPSIADNAIDYAANLGKTAKREGVNLFNKATDALGSAAAAVFQPRLKEDPSKPLPKKKPVY